MTREKWSRVLEVNFREEEGSKNIFTRTTALGRVWSEVSGPQNQRATALVGTKVWGNAVLLRRPKAGSLYRMLRPELVRTNDVPLSSDAWTKFQSSDPAREEHNEEVNCATQRLLKHVIPAFAEHLQRHTVTPVNHNELANLMHRHGINIRFMGMVRKLLTRPHLKSFLLTDMVSRVVKEKLRGELRVWVGFKASEARRRLVVDYFNKVFGRSAAADDFWRLEVAVGVQHKFIYGLAVEEAMPGYDIRQNILMFSLFNRISEITGVRFKPGTYKRLFEHPFLFDSSAPFTYGDLEGLSASRKNASIISEDMGTLIRAAVAEEEAQTLRLLEQIGDRQALAAFEAVCQVKTHRRTETILGADSKEAVASLFDLARTHLRSGNNTMALDAAIRGLSYGEVLFGVFSEVALNGAVLLGGIYQRMGDLSRAIEYYGRALDAVQRLYKQHPLVGTLTSKLYFCSEALTRKSGAHPAHDHLLAKSYASFCEMYGRDAAALLLPLLGYEQSDPAFANVIQDLVQVKDEEKSLLENSRFLWPPGLYESLGKVATSKNTATPQEDLVLSYNSLLSPEQNSSHSVLRQNHQKPATATSSSFPSSSSSSSSSSLLFVNRCCDSQCSPLQTSPLPPLSSPLPPAANPSLVALQKQKQMCTSRSAVFSKSIEVPKMQENFSLVNEDDEKKCSGYT